MKIGNLEVKGFAALAPMAGVADRAMREICRKHGAAFCVGELASARGITLGDKKSAALLSCNGWERPMASQLFGHEPDIMAYSAKVIEDMGFNMIDINCGCPAPKIYKNGDGSALMLNPHLIYQIVHEIRKATNVILSVKLRIGYDGEN